LLLAADPFFSNNRQEVGRQGKCWQISSDLSMARIRRDRYGPNLRKVYEWAGQMVASILNSTTRRPTIPAVRELQDADFELVVKKTTAVNLDL
jgi:hypothetical protein